MANYIVLWNWTEQGVKNVSETKTRVREFAGEAEKDGVRIKDVFWTMGEYDGVMTVEAPNDEAMTKVMFRLAKRGNARTRTLRAFNRDEIGALLP